MGALSGGGSRRLGEEELNYDDYDSDNVIERTMNMWLDYVRPYPDVYNSSVIATIENIRQ